MPLYVIAESVVHINFDTRDASRVILSLFSDQNDQTHKHGPLFVEAAYGRRLAARIGFVRCQQRRPEMDHAQQIQVAGQLIQIHSEIRARTC